jgi:hypothetical protein
MVPGSTALPLNGSTDIIAQVIEPSGTPPQHGTTITFTTNLGSIQPPTAETDVSGRVTVKFLAGTSSGTATITAISGGVSATGTNAIKIAVGSAAVGLVSLSASPATLSSAGGTSTITATVTDTSGNILSSVPVTFAIDTATAGSSGSFSETQVNTDVSGRAQTLLTTNRTTTVSATAGFVGASGTTGPSVLVAKVTVTVNTTASITIGAATPSAPTVGQIVTFPLSYGTAATASPIVRGTVNWGDGQSQTFSGQPAAISHSYSGQGSYLIVVTGVDALGDTSTTTTSVTVTARVPLAVSIATTKETGPSGTNVTATATVTPTSAIAARFDWSWGDGTTTNTTSNTTSHFYNTGAGARVITVTVTSTDGQTASNVTTVFIP